jgi:hypothetical protein
MKKLLLISVILTIAPIIAVVLVDARKNPAPPAGGTPKSVQQAESRAPTLEPQQVPAQPPAAPTPAHEGAQRAAAPAAYPIPVAPSLARLVDPTRALPGMEIPELHRQLEAEPKDLTWAPQIEYEIQNFIRSASAGTSFSLELVECRTTMCELQVTATDPAARAAWSKLLVDMQQQPWAKPSPQSLNAAAEDEVTKTTSVLTILKLRQTPAQ